MPDGEVAALGAGRGLAAGVRQPRHGAGRRGDRRPRASTPGELRSRIEDADARLQRVRGGLRRPRAGARRTRSAPRRSSTSPDADAARARIAEHALRRALDRRDLRLPDGRACPRAAADRLRHLERRGVCGAPPSSSGLARVERHRGRTDRGPRAAGDDRRGRARRTRRRWSCTATSTSCPGGRDQFEPRIDGDRLLGRGAYDMKGALAVMLLVLARPPRPGRTCALRLGIVSDEESEEEDEPRLRRARRRAASSATSRSPASRPTSRSGSQAKGVLAMRLRGRRARRPRRDAVAGRQRGRQGGRGVPGDRVATVCTPQLRPVRPALDQSRSDPGRRRPEQSARYLRHRRRYPLPARPGSRRDPRAGERPAGHRACSPPSGARRRWSSPTRPSCRALCEAASPHHPERVMSVGRDGASDAVSFLRAGVPAVEFGPIGDGHHGPRSGSRSPRCAATGRRSRAS